MISISHHQLRAARSLVDLDQRVVSQATGISANAISRIERGEVSPQEKTKQKLMNFYEEAGVEFTEHNGVRERAEVSSKIYRGQKGFVEFAYDVYETIKQNGGGEVYVSNVDERQWDKWMHDNREEYLRNMESLNKFKSKIIICKGDDYKVARYAEYRQIESKDFGSVPSYVYGEKVAMILFKETDCTIVVINNREIAEAHRVLFERLWQSAQTQNETGRKI